MHRYSAAGGSSGIGNSSGSGGTGRESRGSDSSFASATTFPLPSRRANQQLVPYKLKCEREPLSSRLGPPDFYPPAANCPEEVLNRDSCVNGYKEIIDGVEESNEAKLSLTSQAYNNLWNKQNVNRYKEAIRKRLRALNNALIRKRKAGQVYGVPLSGNLLAKPGNIPEQRTCGDDFRKKWIEDLSQRKRLRSLAEHVPHGYRRRALFEILIKHEVPRIRATWFIKIVYLNQVRPLSIGISSGGPDKSQTKRVELWTKEVLEYAQTLLDECCSSHATSISSLKQGADAAQGSSDNGELELRVKWRYFIRLVQWQLSEGLLHRQQFVDWSLKQLQEKDSVEVLQSLLPVILKVIDGLSLSQTHVRSLVDLSLNWLEKLCPSASVPSNVIHSSVSYCAASLTELLRHLLLIVPDTFVALDCFPLPACVCPAQPKEDSFLHVLSAGRGRIKDTPIPISDSVEEMKEVKMGADPTSKRRYAYSQEKRLSQRELLIVDVVDAIQKRAASLAKAVNPGLLRNNEGKVVQGLDKALAAGEVQGACRCVFDEEFCSSEQLLDDWQADVVVGFGRTPTLLNSVNSSELFAVRFLCEWAVCDFRDTRGIVYSSEQKGASFRDMSRVYMAVSVLRTRMEELKEKRTARDKGGRSSGDLNGQAKSKAGRYKGRDEGWGVVFGGNSRAAKSQVSDMNPSHPSVRGPLHNLIVAWLDQHELRKGDSTERLQLLLSELVRENLFWPDVYVRQLLYSGVLERNETAADKLRAARHKLVLRNLQEPLQLSSSDSISPGASRVYRNERFLALHGYSKKRNYGEDASPPQKAQGGIHGRGEVWMAGGSKVQDTSALTGSKTKTRAAKFLELKQAIATCLQLPDGFAEDAISSAIKSQDLLKRQVAVVEITPGCEECSRMKRSKLNDGKAWVGQVTLPAHQAEEESWWLRKGQKALEAVKVEPPVKPSLKQNTRGRPKTVRKTQSLAQLAAARIEGSQGASSSHTCDSRVDCPYHRSGHEDTANPHLREKIKQRLTSDVRGIGNHISRLKLKEKKLIATWLDTVVRDLVSGGGKVSSPPVARNSSASGYSLNGAPNSAELGASVRWRMTEEQLAVIIYILDVANDFHTLVHLILWLLPTAPVRQATPPGHGSRGMASSPWVREHSSCDVGESTLLSCLRRYEGLLAAMDLLPQALSAATQRAVNLMAVVPGGRAGCAALLCHVRDLLRKYGTLPSVQAWEKNWKVTGDQRLVAELEALKAGDSEGSFGLMGLDDRDDAIPRLTGRLSRFGGNLKDIVTRGMNEAFLQMLNKEREAVSGNGVKERVVDSSDEGSVAAQRVVGGVMEVISQQNSGVMQAETALAAAAVVCIVSNASTSVANVFESLGVAHNSGTSSALRCARRVLQMHMLCLRLLKEALNDRHSRMVDVALASEASSLVLQSLQHSSGRNPRSQFHVALETSENPGLANDAGNSLARTTICAAAVAALVAGVVVQGTTTLERMISVLKLRENLEPLQISKTLGTNSSSLPRSTGGNSSKEHLAEAHIYWVRVLIGNCRTAGGGLVADLLGESNVLGLSRMQRTMPLTAALPPAYALFGGVLRRQPPSAYVSASMRGDSVLQAAITAVNEVVSHEPFRDVCLHDTRALYLLLTSDSGDSDYAAVLDMQGLDARSKAAAMVPLRARLFLHALLDRGLPHSLLQEEESWVHGRVDVRNRFPSEPRQLEQLVRILDDLQPATYHWQWLELRLLLNEQVFMEKLEGLSASEAVQAAAAGSDTGQLTECEKTFTEVVLTRLLVRPDAAALYSEAVASLGRALEEYLILQVKWVLEGTDMLLGRRSLQQLLENIAHRQGFSVGTRRVPAWGWQPPGYSGEVGAVSSEKKKSETASPEEGEVPADGSDWRHRDGKQNSGGMPVAEQETCCREFAVEKALADLVLPCLARSPTDTCTGFAFELIKQMSNLEQQITSFTRSAGKTVPASNAGGEGPGGKSSGMRRGTRTGFETSSPGIGRKFMGSSADSSPVSAAALQTSMWLRLQFLLPLLPIIQADRDQTGRNMRQTLAPVLLRLLGTRVVQEATESPHILSAREIDRAAEASSAAATAAAGEGLFDRLLTILHALLSSSWAVWLKPQPKAKGSSSKLREVPPFDREAAERMQIELENMQLPRSARARLQAAMPLLPVSSTLTIAAGPPQVPSQAIAVMTQGVSVPSSGGFAPIGVGSKSAIPSDLEKGKYSSVVEPEVEYDPWTLLEDGVGSGGNSGLGGGDTANLKACSWLRGSVRVRRSDLTYVGAVDDDS